MADEDLSIYEYRLLGHYTRACGNNGKECEESIRETAAKCQISLGKASEARRSLSDKGWIKLRSVPLRPNSKPYKLFVSLVDRWDENKQRYAKEQLERSPHEQPDVTTGEPEQDSCSPHERIVHHMNNLGEDGCSPHEHIKKNYIEEQKEEEHKSVHDAPHGGHEDAPTPPQETLEEVPKQKPKRKKASPSENALPPELMPAWKALQEAFVEVWFDGNWAQASWAGDLAKMALGKATKKPYCLHNMLTPATPDIVRKAASLRERSFRPTAAEKISQLLFEAQNGGINARSSNTSGGRPSALTTGGTRKFARPTGESTPVTPEQRAKLDAIRNGYLERHPPEPKRDSGSGQ